MANPKRTLYDVKMIRILTYVVENGWVVEIEYKDGYTATFCVEYGDRSLDMLDLSVEDIRRQLHG